MAYYCEQSHTRDQGEQKKNTKGFTLGSGERVQWLRTLVDAEDLGSIHM